MADLRTWSKELIVELIALYKSFPCLWKIKSEEYKHKILKDEAYKKIVDFCKERGFAEANRDFVVKKLQSLRGSFRKELNKVTESQRSGTDDVYKSSLWYYDHMVFTAGQELPNTNIEEEPDGESLTDDNCHQYFVVNNDGTDSRAGDTDQLSYVTDPESTATPPRNKRKATSNYHLEFKTIDTFKPRDELSEFDIAGMNMAKKLAKMDPVQAIYAESIVNNALRKGLLRQLTEDSDICDSCTRRRAPSCVQSSQQCSCESSLLEIRNINVKREPSSIL